MTLSRLQVILAALLVKINTIDTDPINKENILPITVFMLLNRKVTVTKNELASKVEVLAKVLKFDAPSLDWRELFVTFAKDSAQKHQRSVSGDIQLQVVALKNRRDELRRKYGASDAQEAEVDGSLLPGPPGALYLFAGSPNGTGILRA